MDEKNWECRIGIHKWVLEHEPEGGAAYHVCARCGKERTPDGRSVPPIAS